MRTCLFTICCVHTLLSCLGFIFYFIFYAWSTLCGTAVFARGAVPVDSVSFVTLGCPCRSVWDIIFHASSSADARLTFHAILHSPAKTGLHNGYSNNALFSISSFHSCMPFFFYLVVFASSLFLFSLVTARSVAEASPLPEFLFIRSSCLLFFFLRKLVRSLCLPFCYDDTLGQYCLVHILLWYFRLLLCFRFFLFLS